MGATKDSISLLGTWGNSSPSTVTEKRLVSKKTFRALLSLIYPGTTSWGRRNLIAFTRTTMFQCLDFHFSKIVESSKRLQIISFSEEGRISKHISGKLLLQVGKTNIRETLTPENVLIWKTTHSTLSNPISLTQEAWFSWTLFKNLAFPLTH